jgi:hypothetical protein
MVRVGADTKDMERGLKSARAKMKAFGGQMRKIGKVAAVAGAAVVGAFGLMIKSYIKAGDEVHKMALRTGFSTDALSELKYAAEISGTTLESLEKGVKKMSKTILDASDGLMTYVRAFDRIGLKAEELIELSPEDQFDRIARAIASVENPTIRAATAQEIFGRAGTQLLPLFAAGEEGLEKLRKKAHELGIVFDQEAADKAAALTDALTTLKGSITGVTMGIAEKMVPALTVMVEAISTSMTNIKGDTGAMTASILNFFMLIAKGVMGLGMLWHGLQAVIFKVASMVVKNVLWQIDTMLLPLKMLAMLPGMGVIAKKVLDGVAKHTDNLRVISEGYNDTAEIQLDKTTDLVVMMEELQEKLDSAAESYKKLDGAAKPMPEGMKATTLEAREFYGALDHVQGSLDSYVYGTEKVKTANELLMESWNLTSEAQLQFSEIMISEFSMMEGSLKGFVKAILGTLEKWAIGEIIPRVMAALPFPINLLAVGGAIAAIKALFAGISSFREGGFVPKETMARLHPGEFVLSAPMVKALRAPAAARPGASSLTANITINIPNQLDPYSAQKITRQVIIPQILESLDINENKRKWQEKLE